MSGMDEKAVTASPVTPATVSRETFAYYLSEAENGWCKIPRRVADDMALYCANLEAKLAEARKVIEHSVEAWEDLPGGRNYGLNEVAKWVQGPMYAAVQANRRFLEETK